MPYSRAAVSQHFATTPETIRRWSRDFASYLSPGANDASKSSYTDSDVTVLDYVHQRYQANATTDDISVELASGQRGSFDGTLRRQTVAITEAQADAIWQVRQERDELRQELIEANQRIAVLESQVSDVQALREQINALNRELGRLEAKLEMSSGEK